MYDTLYTKFSIFCYKAKSVHVFQVTVLIYIYEDFMHYIARILAFDFPDLLPLT